jgi:hypothetical protein
MLSRIAPHRCLSKTYKKMGCMAHTNDPNNSLSLFLRLNEPDAKPSADHSAWVLSVSEEAGPAANDEGVKVHGWSDALVVAFWLACCAGLWVIAL